MRPLTVAALAPEREVRARVSTGGMIRWAPYAVRWPGRKT